jgi:glycosyltransferase involved in cell wall biosynthesis
LDNNKISIAVALPVYNGLPLLKESVESVLQRRDVDFELVIGDDCSQDGSFEYLSGLKDSRIRLFRNSKNFGLFGNLNNIIKNCNSEIIHLWSQDDIMLPTCLKETLEFHKKHPNLAFAFCKYYIINERGEITGENKLNKNELISVEGHAISSLVAGSIAGNIANVSLRKSDFEKLGYFNEQLKYSGDFDMWCRLSSKWPVGIIQRHLIKLRNHEKQLSKKKSMWIYRLKENKAIYDEFLKRVGKDKLKYVKRGLKWRVYTQYFGLYLKLIRSGEKELAYFYGIELKSQCNIYITALRYSLLFIIGKIGLRKKFLQKLYFDKL